MSYKILLKGYFGFSNLGDDLIMTAGYHFLKSLYPQAKFYVLSFSKQNQYIKKHFPDISLTSHPSDRLYDIVCTPGGGIYFDFEEGGSFFKCVNFFFKHLPAPFSAKLLALFRFLLKKPLHNARVQIGFGIGIGTFTPSSKKFNKAIENLGNYNLLCVRDKESYQRALRYKIKNVYCLTDSIFLKKYWSDFDNLDSNKSHDIGFILRDSSLLDHTYFTEIKYVIDVLRDQNHSVAIYSFDKQNDFLVYNTFQNDPHFYQYDPSQHSVNEFILLIRQCTTLFSARAHGLLIARLLQIPVCGIKIEEKISIFHRIIPKSSSLASISESIKLLKVKEIYNDLLNITFPNDDLKVQLHKAQRMEDIIAEFLSKQKFS